ncbi:MAG TPA: Holliday junction branch migration protein RuvA [Opitutaceae bacterium]
MIVSLKGILVSANPLSAVIDVHGVGYEVHIPVTTAERLPLPGTEARLLTVAVYRDDSQALYGFATAEERDFFKLLVENVSGVGPKVALTILSRLSIPVLRTAILDGDVGLLSKCHGIGKKTAERLVVELKDKLGASPAAISTGLAATATAGRDTRAIHASSRESRVTDAVKALVTLGYKFADAEKSVIKASAALGANAATEELVRRALSG